jgi:hypothetical protein
MNLQRECQIFRRNENGDANGWPLGKHASQLRF